MSTGKYVKIFNRFTIKNNYKNKKAPAAAAAGAWGFSPLI